jgi:hypothetical protein
MAESSKKDAGAAITPVNASPKPQLLRLSTIIHNYKIDGVTASAVMTANKLNPGSRIEPAKFLKMVEQFRNRKIKNPGGKR